MRELMHGVMHAARMVMRHPMRGPFIEVMHHLHAYGVRGDARNEPTSQFRRAEARRSARNRSPYPVLTPSRTARTLDKSRARASPRAPTSNLRDEQVPVIPTA